MFSGGIRKRSGIGAPGTLQPAGVISVRLFSRSG